MKNLRIIAKSNWPEFSIASLFLEHRNDPVKMFKTEKCSGITHCSTHVFDVLQKCIIVLIAFISFLVLAVSKVQQCPNRAHEKFCPIY